MLPPGRERLGTRPVLTGSATRVMTMGIEGVAFLAAWAAGVLMARMASTLSRTSSSAMAASRSFSPPECRNSIVMVLPST
jgi:Na+-transporting methylmalonyl-CoA/oxaloacetate decarboxylase beta subunit